MQAQAGTVIGGLVLSSRPQHPSAARRLRFGRRDLKRSKTRAGAAQSSPMTATFMRSPREAVAASSRARRGRPLTAAADDTTDPTAAGRSRPSGAERAALDGADGGGDLRPDHPVERIAPQDRLAQLRPAEVDAVGPAVRADLLVHQTAALRALVERGEEQRR